MNCDILRTQRKMIKLLQICDLREKACLKIKFVLDFLERAKGFELSISTLARLQVYR